MDWIWPGKDQWTWRQVSRVPKVKCRNKSELKTRQSPEHLITLGQFQEMQHINNWNTSKIRKRNQSGKNSWNNDDFQELPWLSIGLDSMLPIQWTWVLSLVGELRSHMPHSMAKNVTENFVKLGPDTTSQF